MTIETKRELIRYKIFNGNFDYDTITYRIINFELFDDIIKKIDDNSFYVNCPINNTSINADQFISLLNYLVKTIRDLFFNSNINELTIREIIGSNIELTNNYFNYRKKIFPFNNNIELNKIIYKLTITNFISNAKYIDTIEQLLNDNNLKLKNINDYSNKEINKIVKLISNISFCEKTQGKSDCLFVSIDKTMKEDINRLKENNRKKYTGKTLLQYFINNYNDLITNYNEKKSYLKYFIEEF